MPKEIKREIEKKFVKPTTYSSKSWTTSKTKTMSKCENKVLAKNRK